MSTYDAFTNAFLASIAKVFGIDYATLAADWHGAEMRTLANWLVGYNPQRLLEHKPASLRDL